MQPILTQERTKNKPLCFNKKKKKKKLFALINHPNDAS